MVQWIERGVWQKRPNALDNVLMTERIVFAVQRRFSMNIAHNSYDIVYT